MKKPGKNKKLLGICLGFALVSLTTIGLSTWLVGIQNASVTLDELNVVVDGVSDHTSFLNIKVDTEETGINISDVVKSTIDTNKGGVSLDGESKHDFEVKLSDFDIVYSEDATFNELTVKTSLMSGDSEESWPTGSISGKTISFGETTYTDYFGRNADTTLTFIELDMPSSISTDLTNNGFTLNDDYEGYHFYTKTNKTLEFKRGSMFTDDTGTHSPIEYYNDKIENADSTDKKLQMLNQIKTELGLMNTLFSGKTIKITFNLSVTPANSN